MFEKLVDDLAYDVTVRDRFMEGPEAVCNAYGLDETDKELFVSGNSAEIEARYRAAMSGASSDVRMAAPTTVIVVTVLSPSTSASGSPNYWSNVVAHCEAMAR